MTRDLRTTNLREAKPEDPKKGYSGVDGARSPLNDMIVMLREPRGDKKTYLAAL